MKLFGSGKITTLTYCVFLFEDNDHRDPGSASARNSFGAKFIPALLKKHYADTLKPPKKWNYYCALWPLNFNDERTRVFDFRNPVTHEINDKAKFNEMCSALKGIWKERLRTVFPDYNRNRMEDSLEEAKFDYFPAECVIIISSLADGLVKGGSEEFKDTSLYD